MKKLLITGLLILVLTSCTKNEFAKQFGGTITVNVPPKTKLVNVTWKENQLWLLTKPMTDTDKAETYEFIEDSQFGILEGKVVLKESK